MILSTHFIAGAAIASSTDSLILLVVLPIVLHFLLDSIPHWEYLENTKEITEKNVHILLDILIGPFLVLFFIFLSHGMDFKKIIWLFLGGTISVLPDGFTFLYFTFPKNKFLGKIFSFHQFIHSKKALGWQIGFAFQALINIAAIILICVF